MYSSVQVESDDEEDSDADDILMHSIGSLGTFGSITVETLRIAAKTRAVWLQIRWQNKSRERFEESIEIEKVEKT